jgi:uncharacterized protein YjaG (DUF416 family)
MLLFNEKELSQKIERLVKQHRVAFAAACAERLLPSYARFSRRSGRGDYLILVDSLESLWKDLISHQSVAMDIDLLIGNCMGLIPGEDDQPWVNEQACAEDAASAVAYALRCFQTGEAKEAARAAR